MNKTEKCAKYEYRNGNVSQYPFTIYFNISICNDVRECIFIITDDFRLSYWKYYKLLAREVSFRKWKIRNQIWIVYVKELFWEAQESYGTKTKNLQRMKMCKRDRHTFSHCLSWNWNFFQCTTNSIGDS